MKNAVELNRLLLNFVFLCQVDIQENSRKDIQLSIRVIQESKDTI